MTFDDWCGAKELSMEDPFADLRGKRIGELTAEQTDRSNELWLREQIGPWEGYWYPHLQALFRVIDRLRAQQAEPVQRNEPSGYESITPAYTRWVSPARYAKFHDKVKRWYRPYWVPKEKQRAEPSAFDPVAALRLADDYAFFQSQLDGKRSPNRKYYVDSRDEARAALAAYLGIKEAK